MNFYCPCGFQITTADNQGGETILCPSCRRPLIVPGMAPPPVAAAAEQKTPKAPGMLPARIWNHLEPMRSAGRVASTVGGILLLCLFFLPLGKGEDGTLLFLWKLAPEMPREVWFLAIWTLSLGVLAFAGGLFARALPLGIILAGGAAVSLALMIVMVPAEFRGIIWSPVVAALVLMFFVAGLRLRRMFPDSKMLRILSGIASGMAFLLCLLPIEGQIAVQTVVADIKFAPHAGLVFGTILAGILGLIVVAPLGAGALSGLSTLAESLVYLGIMYFPARLILGFLQFEPAATSAAVFLLIGSHVFLRALIVFVLGALAFELLIGAGPSARKAAAEGEQQMATNQ